MKLNLDILQDSLTIHRLSPDSKTPEGLFQCSFYHISRTDEELSIVCPSSLPVNSENSNPGWSCIKVIGPLDFSLTGILAEISGLLANAKISIFAISTFDTDYILVKTESLENAKMVLQKAGHNVKHKMDS